jgi:hypothetical protein
MCQEKNKVYVECIGEYCCYGEWLSIDDFDSFGEAHLKCPKCKCKFVIKWEEEWET